MLCWGMFWVVLLLCRSLEMTKCFDEVEWCEIGRTLCPQESHIACLQDIPGGQCSGFLAVELTNRMKSFILERHNFYRNLVADGREWKASRMMEISWSSTLQIISERYGKRCEPLHGGCRLIPGVRRVFHHQSYQLWWSPKIYVKEFIRKSIDSWYSMHEYPEAGKISRGYFTVKTESFQEDFITMVQEDVQKMGCSYVVFREGKKFGHLFTCDYASSGIQETNHTFKIGNPCSECDSLRSTCSEKYPNLCRGAPEKLWDFPESKDSKGCFSIESGDDLYEAIHGQWEGGDTQKDQLSFIDFTFGLGLLILILLLFFILIIYQGVVQLLRWYKVFRWAYQCP